jgi:hypothetical protein
MALRYKILIALGVMLIVGTLSFIVYKQIEISKRQQAIETNVVAQKTLVDNIVRSSNEYATKKDIDAFIKSHDINIKAIQDDMKKLHAEIAAVNVVTVVSNPQIGNHIPVTNVGPVNTNPNPVPVCPDGTICPNVDPYGYLKAQQNLSLNENFGDKKVPIGSVGFSAWQKDPWNIDIKGREYSVSSVVGTDENQRTYFYNKFSVTVDGKSYDVPITKAETKQEYPEAKFSWWNPRLFMGMNAGVSINPTLAANISPNVNIGIMSYGKYKNNPDFSVLEVGAGYDVVSKSYQVTFTPFTYNVGRHIPLMNNVYIGPSLQVGTNGSFSITGTLQVGL